ETEPTSTASITLIRASVLSPDGDRRTPDRHDEPRSLPPFGLRLARGISILADAREGRLVLHLGALLGLFIRHDNPGPDREANRLTWSIAGPSRPVVRAGNAYLPRRFCNDRVRWSP